MSYEMEMAIVAQLKRIAEALEDLVEQLREQQLH